MSPIFRVGDEKQFHNYLKHRFHVALLVTTWVRMWVVTIGFVWQIRTISNAISFTQSSKQSDHRGNLWLEYQL